MPKLLIVDDEADVREFAAHFFKKRAIDVVTAAGGKEALAAAESEKLDLILLDIRMGEMTGIEVLRRLRNAGNSVKVVMVTGVENDQTIQEAQGLGISGYIHKPLVLEELEKVVLAELAK